MFVHSDGIGRGSEFSFSMKMPIHFGIMEEQKQGLPSIDEIENRDAPMPILEASNDARIHAIND